MVFANNDDGYRTALDMAAAGIDVRGLRPGGAPAVWRDRAEAAGIECRPGMAVARTHGYLDLTGVDVAPLSDDGRTLAGDLSFILRRSAATSAESERPPPLPRGWAPGL